MNTNIRQLLRICVLALTAFSLNVFGQGMCGIPLKEGVYKIYENGLAAGWSTTGSWGVSVPTPNQTIAGQHDTLSMRVDFLTAWSGVELSNPLQSMTGRTALAFRIRKEHVGADVLVGIHRSTTGTVDKWVSLRNYIVPNVVTEFEAQKWYSVVVPYGDLQLATESNISGFVFMSSVPETMYLDYVVLGDAPLLDFPLKNGWTPDTAVIASVMDHTMTKTLARDTDPIVTAWTGEKGDGAGYTTDLTCKKAISNVDFTLGGQYHAPSSCGGPSNAYLSYDGHTGIDYRVTMDTSVYAAADGVILPSSVNGNNQPIFDCPQDGTTQCSNYGRIIIQHQNGYQTWYQHLSKQVGGLNIGSSVIKGQPIGKSGSTGPSGTNYAPHLHFEVRFQGIPVDPYGWTGPYKDPYRVLHPAQFNYRLWK